MKGFQGTNVSWNPFSSSIFFLQGDTIIPKIPLISLPIPKDSLKS